MRDPGLQFLPSDWVRATHSEGCAVAILVKLSSRELQIAQEYAHGASYQQIARRLFIAPSTVRAHVRTIYRKLEVSSKVGLLKELQRCGLGSSGLPAIPAASAAESSAPEFSIAVLPFVNMSSDAEQEYFSDGISEELLNLLVKIPQLRVISRSSAFSFKGKDVAVPEIARQLNVANILEGSVRKAGNRVRVTVQLIEAQSDTELWSEAWDRPFDDVFAIQDEIAAKVVEKLKVTLLGEIPQARETDPAAYALFLQARFLGHQISAEAFAHANSLYQQALTIDPDYAAAWEGLARNYFNMAVHGLMHSEEGAALAREAAEKAMAIDPNFAMAHSLRGWIAMCMDNDLAQAARHFDRALQLAPDRTSIIGDAGVLLQCLGRLDEAILLQEYDRAHNPVDSTCHANLGENYVAAGRWDDGIASLETALRLAPGGIAAHYWIGLALLLKGEAAAALQSFEREPYEEYRLKGSALALHALGREEEYRARLAELIVRWGQQRPAEVAQVCAWTGDADRAFEWLDRAVARGDRDFPYVVTEPLFAKIRDDARWLPFLDRIGKAPAQLDAVRFEVRLPRR
jgi:TolB-like protein/DNA-binding CsgD family transcriptional regulator/Tfp pilus assembly protein PilF